MLIFQTKIKYKSDDQIQPVSRLSNIVPVKIDASTKIYAPGVTITPQYSTTRGFGIDAGSTVYVKQGNSKISISPLYSIAKGQAPSLTGAFYVTLPTGSLVVDYGTLARWGVTLNSSTGIGLSYSKRLDEILTGQYQFSIGSTSGPAGDAYSIAKLFKSLKAGSAGFSTWLSGIKGIADAMYSIFKPIVESIWPTIEKQTEPPSQKVLDKIRNAGKEENNKNLPTIIECLQVLQWTGCDKKDRSDAATLLEILLMGDLYNLGNGQKNLLSLSDWDKLMPILKKNKEFFSSTGWAAIRQTVDLMRMNIPSQVAFAPFSEGVAGNILNSFIGSLLNVEEYTIVLPRIGKILNLFDGVFSFKNTSEGEGFFGKIFGFMLDVVNMPLQLVSNGWAALSPIQRKSDVRSDEAANNIKKVIDENKRILSKAGKDITVEERTTLYSNLLYLTNMLPYLADAGHEKLADKIGKHVKEHALFYELLFCRMTRAEIGSEKEEGSLLYKIANTKDPKVLAELRNKLNGAFSKLNESYLYLQTTDYSKAGDMKLELYAERRNIEKLLALIEKKQDLALGEDGKKLKTEYEGKLKEIEKSLKSAGLSTDEQQAKINERTKLKNNYLAARRMLKQAKFQEEKNTYVGLEDFNTDRESLVELYKDLNNGKMTENWKIMADVFKGGAFYEGSTLTDRQQAAFDAIRNLVDYSGRYDVLSGYIEQWADKQDKNTMKNALSGLMKLVNSEAKTGNYDHIGYLAVIDRLFPEFSAKYKGSDALKDEIETFIDGMSVGMKDMKSPEAKENFIVSFNYSIGIIQTLCGMGSLSAVDKGDLKDWATEKLPEAMRTLYNLIKSSSKSGDGYTMQNAAALWVNAMQAGEVILRKYGVSILQGFDDEEVANVRGLLTAYFAALQQSKK